MWETNSTNESEVQWGQSIDLGFNTEADLTHHTNNYYIHHVYLTDLSPDTRYYYKAITGSLESDIFDFVTQTDSDSEASMTLVAMSDMQKDWNNFNKFQEIINQGIIAYFGQDESIEITDLLDLVIIPGDLVDNGLNHNEWSDHFFGPSEPLFSHIPVYPVLGNHENNSSHYFSYFNLPENGTNGYEEHWWWTDFSNVRIIGLNSNWEYQLAIQLNWLEEVLEETCLDTSIDFVFAQLHHPHKSELWVPGETNFTGDVVELLENFTTDCGKPSIHYFGHTHGYSRGQSIDHRHAMVNVASAGGAIDYWGEYEQTDYPEFSVTQDEWGFIVVDVEAGLDPRFTLKRISRGDDDTQLDNVLTDQFTIRMNNNPPDIPVPVYPIEIEVSPDSVWLWGNTFSDPDNDLHGFSQWEVYTECSEVVSPIISIYESYENWYYDVNTQEGNSLINELITGLDGNMEYCWRVRYRDKGLMWSEWSDPEYFTTGESLYSPNLLINPGAENGTSGWTVEEGVFESLEASECNGISPHSGQYYFCVGGLCEESQYAEVFQIINVMEFSTCINESITFVKFGGFLSDWSGWDQPAMFITFIDQNGSELGSSDTIATLNSTWTEFDTLLLIPPSTQDIKFTLMGTRNGGQDNDSYFDDLFLRIIQDETCTDETNIESQLYEIPMQFNLKQNYPNPFNSSTNISYKISNDSFVNINILDLKGERVMSLINKYHSAGKYSIEWNGKNEQGASVSAGLYIYTFKVEGNVQTKKMLLLK